MSLTRQNSLYWDEHVAELYDRQEANDADVALLRRFLPAGRSLRILEPFCGSGRILIRLAQDGHQLVGLDNAAAMLVRARAKVKRLDLATRQRIDLRRADVTDAPWPEGFDVIILAGNCLYELPTPDAQRQCVQRASMALRPGGYVYVDNDHMEGPLPASWCDPSPAPAFPTGRCADGTHLESTMRTVGHDAERRLARFRRDTRIISPGGRVTVHSFEQQKHPVSATEVQEWLQASGFAPIACFGDWSGARYRPDSPRAIFWARKPVTRQNGSVGVRPSEERHG
jgi:SAM-dependent methyltransferase